MERRYRRFATTLVCCAALLLGGCGSAVSLTYRQFDWLIPWYLDDFVSLDATQQRELDRRLGVLLDWHRSQELPRYAALLRELRAELADRLDDAELARWQDRLRDEYQRLARRLLPDAADLLASLSDAQLDELFANLAQRNERYRERYLEGEPEQRHEHRRQRVEEQLEHWLGSVTNAQRLTVRQWSRHSLGSAELSLAYREFWQSRFRQVLEARAPTGDGHGRPTLRDALEPLVVEPEAMPGVAPELRAQRQQRRRQFSQLLLQIDRQMTSAQRAHLLRRLDRLIDDFSTLASNS